MYVFNNSASNKKTSKSSYLIPDTMENILVNNDNLFFQQEDFFTSQVKVGNVVFKNFKK